MTQDPLGSLTSTSASQAEVQDLRRRMNQQPAISDAQETATAALAQPPIGSVTMFAGPGVPVDGKWLICDGAVLSRLLYPDLFAVIGTTWNDGTETPDDFRLPNSSGRTPVGAGQGVNLTNRPLGTYQGAETHKLLTTELPIHAHSCASYSHSHGGFTDWMTHDHGGFTGSVAHNHGGVTGKTTHYHNGDDYASAGYLTGIGGGGSNACAKPLAYGTGATASTTTSHAIAWSTLKYPIPATQIRHGINADTHDHTIGNTGSDTPHNNMQPSLNFTFIIRALP